MLAFLPFLLLAQAYQPMDPLSQRMVIFCKGNPACVAKQKQGVREFLDILTRQRPGQAHVQRCLARSSKKKITDWSKGATCLRSAAMNARRPR
jgi:hypothetical protein